MHLSAFRAAAHSAGSAGGRGDVAAEIEGQEDELSSFFTERGEPAFRAKQVHQWLWQKHARSFDEMSNVAKPLRAFLESHFELLHLNPKTVQKSSDGTVKSALSLHDGKVVESVLITK